MRQVAIDAASLPKDAKIAVLEKSSVESEKMIAEARSDKLRHNAELQQKQKVVTDMESQIRGLETKLNERDAIIKILQSRAYEQQADNVLSIPIQDTSSLIFHNKQVGTRSEFLPAEKGGLRTVDVSECVCLCVCVSFEFPLNFTMVMYGPILIDQSESR